MIRRTIALVALFAGTVAASLTPIPLPAQPLTACGTYLCLTFDYDAMQFLVPTDVRPLAPYDALGATRFGWSADFAVTYTQIGCTGSPFLCTDGGGFSITSLAPQSPFALTDIPGYTMTVTGQQAGFLAFDAADNVIATEVFPFAGPTTTAPEPATLALVGGGVLLLGAWRRWKA